MFWIGSKSIIDNTFTFGTLLSFNALLIYFTDPLFRLINIQPKIQEALVSAERVNEIFENEPEQNEEYIFLKPKSINGDIEFKDVSFRYGTRAEIFKDLSFHIKKGQCVGFVGPSGCGKTTMLKLLLKYYIPDSGKIYIDNNDLNDIDNEILRNHIGYVPQDIFIFSGTVAENIALHKPDADLKEIIDVAKKSYCNSFIENMPEKYNTKLNERGTILSGGEKQRLAIARALLIDPDIIIFDEATSNLDNINEMMIQEILEKLRGVVTIIIITHRLTTIINCDNIFVMDNGKIIDQGKHCELLQKDGLYKKLSGSEI
ncbi:MAG: ATP-binding cassette domain-containing protein [Bacteroidales bacterium]|nr:ATP-binding cassette domain-containing protein [Bacteroidales bacterium]